MAKRKVFVLSFMTPLVVGVIGGRLLGWSEALTAMYASFVFALTWYLTTVVYYYGSWLTRSQNFERERRKLTFDLKWVKATTPVSFGLLLALVVGVFAPLFAGVTMTPSTGRGVMATLDARSGRWSTESVQKVVSVLPTPWRKQVAFFDPDSDWHSTESYTVEGKPFCVMVQFHPSEFKDALRIEKGLNDGSLDPNKPASLLTSRAVDREVFSETLRKTSLLSGYTGLANGLLQGLKPEHPDVYSVTINP